MICHPQILKKAKINSLRTYVQVTEPFLFTKYKGIDPEIGTNQYDVYPRYRTFLVRYANEFLKIK